MCSKLFYLPSLVWHEKNNRGENRAWQVMGLGRGKPTVHPSSGGLILKLGHGTRLRDRVEHLTRENKCPRVREKKVNEYRK